MIKDARESHVETRIVERDPLTIEPEVRRRFQAKTLCLLRQIPSPARNVLDFHSRLYLRFTKLEDVPTMAGKTKRRHQFDQSRRFPHVAGVEDDYVLVDAAPHEECDGCLSGKRRILGQPVVEPLACGTDTCLHARLVNQVTLKP